jgi:hypothetical protein
MATTNIYILRLTGGKYYVGKTSNVEKRYQEHLEGKGSAWTRKYKPLSIEKTIQGASHFEEDKQVLECMSKYGINNVRGGSYVSVELSDSDEGECRKKIRMAANLCARCGRDNHFVATCRATTDVHGLKIDDDDEESEDDCEEVWGCEYCTRTFTTRFGCMIHERSCRATKSSGPTCYKCGREGHYSPECYARRHVDGHTLD